MKEKPAQPTINIQEEIKEVKPEPWETVEFLKLGDTVTSQEAFKEEEEIKEV
mgnify:CR=1 FL=1